MENSNGLEIDRADLDEVESMPRNNSPGKPNGQSDAVRSGEFPAY
jgi:hypothetical protein